MAQTQDWLGGISLDSIPEDIFETYERLMVPAVFRPWADRLLASAELQPGQRVLDVASATGIVARVAAERVGPSGSVTALDFMPGMLEVGRRAAVDTNPSIDWVEGNALSMPLPDASFDVVLCQQGLQFFPDKTAALAEARRMLVPGGQLLVSVWRSIDRSPAVAALQQALERHAPNAAGFLPMAFSLSRAEELRAGFVEAGFSDVSVRIEIASVRFESVGTYVLTYLGSTPVGGIVASLPQDERDAIGADVTESLRDYVDDEGLIFPQEAHVAVARK